MRKIKEILRLHFEQKLTQRQIARSASVSQSTVHEYVTKAEAAGLKWPLGADWDEARLRTTLFPRTAATKPAQHAAPDFAALRQQREQHGELTLELLWEEYRQQNPVPSLACTCRCKAYSAPCVGHMPGSLTEPPCPT